MERLIYSSIFKIWQIWHIVLAVEIELASPAKDWLFSSEKDTIAFLYACILFLGVRGLQEKNGWGAILDCYRRGKTKKFTYHMRAHWTGSDSLFSVFCLKCSYFLWQCCWFSCFVSELYAEVRNSSSDTKYLHWMSHRGAKRQSIAYLN